MTKVQIRETIETVLNDHKHSKALSEALLGAFESKISGSQNPPRINDDGDQEFWCRFHKRYEVESDMVMSKNKSKGYCKAGISRWTKKMNEAKLLDSKAMEALAAGEIEDAQNYASDAISKREDAKNYDDYDYDLDWNEFSGNNKEDETPVKPQRPSDEK